MTASLAKLDEYFEEVPTPKELNENYVATIKEWLLKQPHLPQLTERQIAMFLHNSWYALELTKITIDTYFTVRTNAPDLFNGRTSKEVAELSKTACSVKLNTLCPDGCRVILISLRNRDPDKYDIVGFFRQLFAVSDIAYYQNPFEEGIRLIYDMAGLSLSHIAKFSTSLSAFKKAFVYFQDGIPMRLKAVHIFNANSMLSHFVGILKPLMKKELFELLHTHPDVASLFEFIPQDILPSDYGGKEMSVDELIKSSLEELAKYDQWFVDDEQLGRVDETKRVGKAKNAGDIFGTDGSFKKIDFD